MASQSYQINKKQHPIYDLNRSLPICMVYAFNKLFITNHYNIMKAISLITDPTLLALWKEAQSNPISESASAAVWSQLYNKHIFTEKDWIVAYEYPSESIERRVDITIRYFTGNGQQITLFAFHEPGALNATPKNIQAAEDQARNACLRCLDKPENHSIERIYAISAFGTRGHAWYYDRGENNLKSLCGSADYIELHSADADELRKAFDIMRAARLRM
ncbi:hypothetical protein MW887_000708 [Aspergillus wentii]|nr:hypothetical protein MW887_000708 [Aspergillus wentii]